MQSWVRARAMLRQPAQLACARGRGCGVQHAQHSQPKRCAPAAWTPARPCPPPLQVASLAGASSLRTCGRAPPRVSKLIPGRCTPLLHVTHDSVARPQVKQHTHTGTTHPSRLQQPGLSASVQAHEEQRQHSQGDAYTKRLWAGTHTKNSAVTARPLVVSSVASTGYIAMGIGVLSGVPGEACISRVLLDHKHPAERLVLAAQHSLISHANLGVCPTPAHHGSSICGDQARAQSSTSACWLVLRFCQPTSCSAQSADLVPVGYTRCAGLSGAW